MRQIVFQDGLITLDGGELPGLLVSLRVDGKVKYDEQKVDGISGKSKTPQGWEDHVIMVSLVLTTDEDSDCYEKLDELTPYFKDPDGKADPKIYSLSNRHAMTRGIRLVVCDRMESTESDQDDTILVTLGFTEHRPPVIKTETGESKTPAPGAVGDSKEQPKKDSVIVNGRGNE